MKIIENRDNSKISKHLIFPIYFVKGRQFSIFYILINSKMTSELVSSDYSVFLCLYAIQL